MKLRQKRRQRRCEHQWRDTGRSESKQWPDRGHGYFDETRTCQKCDLSEGRKFWETLYEGPDPVSIADVAAWRPPA